MQLGMVGLGRMGGNMVRRLLRGKHECVVLGDATEIRWTPGTAGWELSARRRAARHQTRRPSEMDADPPLLWAFQHRGRLL